MEKISIHIFKILIFTCFVAISLSEMPRWDMLQHLAMVDRFKLIGTFYPTSTENLPTGVSVYFPGLTGIIYTLVEFFNIEENIEFIQLISIIIIIAFYNTQKYIIKNIWYEYNIKYDDKKIELFLLLLYISIGFPWIQYALELKPDALSFVIGSFFIIYYEKKSKTINHYQIIFLGFTLGICIVFKQQFIGFLIGAIFYYLILNKSKSNFIFGISILIGLFSTIIILTKNENILFWTILVLSDDGFLNYLNILYDHKFLLLEISLFLIICFKNGSLNSILLNIYKFVRYQYKNTPWISILIIYASCAFLSALKVGGNEGNTSYGLVILAPFLFFFFTGSNRNVMYFITLFFLIICLCKAFTVIDRYFWYRDMLSFSRVINTNPSARVLTGSDVYFAARSLKSNLPIEDYWMKALQENKSSNIGGLNRALNSKEYDYLVVENTKNNKEDLNRHAEYIIIFENKIGLILVNKKYDLQ